MDPTTSAPEAKPLPLIFDLRESNSRSAKELRLTELRWFDAAINPFLYRLVRYELELPGGLSSKRGYWIVPRLGFKVCLRTGQVYQLATGARIANYFDLWMCGKVCGSPTVAPKESFFPAAKESLRRWIETQKQEQPAPDVIPLFTEDLETLDRIVYWALFERGLESEYRGTARKLWLELSKLYGPLRTRRTFDLSSSHQLLSFLRYRAGNPSPLYSVELVSGPKKKEVVWKVRNRGLYCPVNERETFSAAYAKAFRSNKI
jgi:hypothetical protein